MGFEDKKPIMSVHHQFLRQKRRQAVSAERLHRPRHRYLPRRFQASHQVNIIRISKKINEKIITYNNSHNHRGNRF